MYIKNNNIGFTLVETIVAMAIFMIVLALSHNAFVEILRNVSVQSRQAQSNVEGIIGLELLRSDIVSAGYGLPWNPDSMSYSEANGNLPQSVYNQLTAAPLAVQGGNDAPATSAPNIQLPGTDYLVLRATNLATNGAAQRWCYMTQQLVYTNEADIAPNNTQVRVKVDWQQSDNFVATDRVTVLTGATDKDPSNQRSLVTSIFTTFNNVQNFPPPIPNLPTPPHPITVDSEPYFVYGISGDTNPSMPHNRADYYVRRPATGMSQRCAPNTGILYKGIVSHANGSLTRLPLLDCVADFQVVYDLDLLNNGSIVEGNATLLNGLSASDIRNQLKNIQVFILTHDGKRDDAYTYPNAAANPTIGVGPPNADGTISATGSTFDFNAIIGTGWEHYRWKVYRIVVAPKNLLVDQK